MKNRKKKIGSPNLTAHRRAIADAEVTQSLSELRRAWNKIGRVERGERLRELTDAGCSTRGIAENLEIAATTVRRHLEIAALPAAE